MNARLLLLALTIGLGGCSAYQMGGPKPAFVTLAITPVRNRTARTGTHAVLHSKLVDAFAGDPRVRLGGGGAVLAAEVTGYDRVGFTTKPNDAFAFDSFRVTFEVRATLTGGPDGRVLFKDRVFRSTATLQNAGDPAAEELSVAPTLFADIAAQIRQAATTAW
ncbi:MAG: hypothetical protein RLZZ322_1201 [Verrucomicrobiota bacterium]|jgi:hypothetical protein